MSLTVDVSFKVNRPEVSTGTSLLITALCNLGAAIVAIGGLGSLQNVIYGRNERAQFLAEVSSVQGMGFGDINSANVFRYYWFHAAYAVVVGVAAVWVLWTSQLAKYRGAIVGLLVVGTLLFIQGSDAFLTLRERSMFDKGEQRDRLNATVAGWIMVAALNAVMVLGLGWEC